MPGPMSAPNGAASVTAKRDPNKRILTGKTQVKRGTLPKGATEMRRYRESLAARKSQEED